MISIGPSVTKAEYECLAHFRYGLRRFLRFSESEARRHGLTPQQHQLLLAIKGFPGRDWATISELAEQLQRRHHSLVGIINRCEKIGLVARTTNPDDRRVINVHLTDAGEHLLELLTLAHRTELQRIQKDFEGLYLGLPHPTA